MLACFNPDLVYPVVEGKPRSSGWQKTAKDFIKNWEPWCRACHTKNRLQVHHKVPYHFAPELELVRSNLMTGCANCHFVLFHANDWSSWVKKVEEEAERHWDLVSACKELPQFTVSRQDLTFWQRMRGVLRG